MTAATGGAGMADLRTEFLRFAAVGGVGFAVDAGLLLAVVGAGWATPISGRMLSFACAVLVTFELNRRWSFRAGARTARWDAFAAYLGVQGAGFLCNLALYSAALVLLPPPLNHPLICLAWGSGMALAVNFAGSRLLVFGRRRRGA